MVNASDCGSEDRGFESHHSPHFPSWDTTLGCRQAVRHQTLTLAFVGSSPAIPAKRNLREQVFSRSSPYDPLAQQAEQLPFKQWVWSSNLQRVTKKSTTPTGVVLFLRKQRRFERLNPTVRWTVGSQCAHWLILYLRRRRKCKRISSGSPKIGEHCQGLADFYLLPLHDSLFTIIEQPIFGK